MANTENMKRFNGNGTDDLKENAINAVEHMQLKFKKNKFYLIMTAISALVAVIGVQYTNGLPFNQSLLPQLFFSTIATTAYATAYILKPGFAAILSPAAAVAFSLVITRDITSLILPLSYILVGFMIGFCIQHKKSRMQTVVRAGFIAAAILTGIFAYQLYLYKGILSYDSFYDTVMDISRNLVSFYKQANENADEVFKNLSPVDLFSDLIKTFAGAFIVLTCFIQVYLASFATKYLITKLDLQEEYFATDLKWELTPSKIASVIFLVAIFIFSTFQSISNIGLMAATVLIMFPIGAGLALVGAKSFTAFLKTGKFLTYVIILLLLFGMMSFIAFFVILLVFIGLVRTLIKNTKLDIFKKS